MYERVRYVSEDILSGCDRVCSFVMTKFKTPRRNAIKGKVGEDYVAFQNAFEALPKASEAFLKASGPYLKASQAFRKACKKFLKRF